MTTQQLRDAITAPNSLLLYLLLLLFLLGVSAVGCGGDEAEHEAADSAVETVDESAADLEAPETEEEEAAPETSAISSEPITCDQETGVVDATSSIPSYEAAGPFDFSTVGSAHGILENDGTRLTVGISNMELSSSDVSGIEFQTPTMAKGDWILMITYDNGTNVVDAATYDPNAGYKKPYRASAELVVKRDDSDQGTILSISPNEGTAVLTGIGGGRACGSFDLANGTKSGASGSFDVELTEI